VGSDFSEMNILVVIHCHVNSQSEKLISWLAHACRNSNCHVSVIKLAAVVNCESIFPTSSESLDLLTVDIDISVLGSCPVVVVLDNIDHFVFSAADKWYINFEV